jgi:prephenate dehydrogenase
MSYLQNKSSDLAKAANLLRDKELFPAVAHDAYYCCVQLMKHILLHSLHNTEDDLKHERTEYNRRARQQNRTKELGTHEFLINKVGGYLKNTMSGYRDFQVFNAHIWELKELRTTADYHDKPFNSMDSKKSLELSKKVMEVLQKY